MSSRPSSWRSCAKPPAPIRRLNVSEYLEYLDALEFASGTSRHPTILQKRIWSRFQEGAGGEALERVIADLRKEDGRFHMEGGSWTNNLSWVRAMVMSWRPWNK